MFQEAADADDDGTGALELAAKLLNI